MTRNPTTQRAIASDIYKKKLILMHFLEHYVTLLLSIGNMKCLNVLVKFSIFWDNVKYTKHAGNIFV